MISMKKIAKHAICAISFSSLILSTAVFAADSKALAPSKSKANAEAQAIEIITRPEIVGLWGMEIPNNPSCVEFYNFRSSNDVVINSGKEWSYAQYEYQPTLDAKQTLAELAMQIRFDNNQVDCSGQQQDQTGEVAQYFIRWKDANNIQFCGTAKGDKCVANLRRVLP